MWSVDHWMHHVVLIFYAVSKIRMPFFHLIFYQKFQCTKKKLLLLIKAIQLVLQPRPVPLLLVKGCSSSAGPTFSTNLCFMIYLSNSKIALSKRTVRSLIHVMRPPTFLFSSLLSANTVDLPRSCLVRTGIAYIGKPSLCNPPAMSFSRSSAR